MKVVILAGGGGLRLWPLSTEERPKQFIKIINDFSLFQNTISRFAKLSSVSDIIIVTNQNYKNLIEKQLGEIPVSKTCHILLEPYKRNTAIAIAFAVSFIKNKLSSDNENILVAPSDHYMEPEEDFLKILSDLNQKKRSEIVTFGIVPTKPETNYGYIKTYGEMKRGLYISERFVEKPSFEKAKKYLEEGNYYWNSGMFFFSLQTFEKELKKHFYQLFELYDKEFDQFEKGYKNFPSISFDYGLMEKTSNIVVKPLDIEWSDLGLWDNLYDILKKDRFKNVFKGKIFSKESKNCMIFSTEKPIYALNMEDIFVIETKKAILIGKKGSSHKVKDLFAEKKRG